MVRSSASASGSHSLDILVHMAKRQMDHMNHIAKEITGQKKSHGKGNHMEKEITWQEKYTEQMAFTQSPSVRNNPKIPTYYLIFAETREIP